MPITDSITTATDQLLTAISNDAPNLYNRLTALLAVHNAELGKRGKPPLAFSAWVLESLIASATGPELHARGEDHQRQAEALIARLSEEANAELRSVL